MTQSIHAALLFNAPLLPREHPDYASEAGVLESVDALGVALRETGHRVTEIAVGPSISGLLDNLEKLRPNVVVNLCEGFAGNSAGESHLAALLEIVGIPYAGASPECLSLVRDKPRTKRVLVGAGISTPDFVEVPIGQPPADDQFRQLLARGPLIVKPAREDASLGLTSASVVIDWDSLVRQLAMVHHRYGHALVESYIAGREFNVGIVELPSLHLLPLAEIEFRASPDLPWPIVTYSGKWSATSDEYRSTPVRCPAEVAPNLAQRVSAAAIAAYRLTGCRDYARIDVRADGEGRVFVLEVNANPDLGPHAGLARMLRAAGTTYSEFALQLIRTSIERPKSSVRPADMPLVNDWPSTIHSSDRDACEPIVIRELVGADREILVEITSRCGVFRDDEIEIADEVLRDAQRDGPNGDYRVLVAVAGDHPVGWSCHGKVPLTDAAFDLYWIVVAPETQGQGIGRRLLAEVEGQVRAAAGRWLLAETSSTAAYDSTRAFYGRCGFQVVGQIDDFYRGGDGKITFGKRLDAV